MTKLIDLMVFLVGLASLVAGVAMKDGAAALIVLGSVLIGTVVMARFNGAKHDEPA